MRLTPRPPHDAGVNVEPGASVRAPRSGGSRLAAILIAAGVLVVVGLWVAAAGGLGRIAPDLVPGGMDGRTPSASGLAAGASASPSSSPSAADESGSAMPSGAASATASPTPSPVPLDPVFGMSGHLMWHDVDTAVRQLDMLRHDGLGVVRFDVSWRNSEPSPGDYRYLDKLDAIVQATVDRGIRPIISIVETPDWANGGQGAWVPPNDPKDYAAFAGMLAGRYAGRADAWEIWNEPDTTLFWKPDPDPKRYAQLLIAASHAIHAANPGATVIGGSVTFGNVDFVKALYDNGAKGHFDALSVHPYTLKRAPDDESDRFHSLTAILDDIHGAMTEEGDEDIPIYVTEFGWAVVGLNSVSEGKRVAYMARTVPLIVDRPWVQVMTMYTIDTQDSERYGLSTNGTRSDAWNAYVDAVRARGPLTTGGP